MELGEREELTKQPEMMHKSRGKGEEEMNFVHAISPSEHALLVPGVSTRTL